MLHDSAGRGEQIRCASEHLARAKVLDPDNPRTAWVEGGALWSMPKAIGGSQTAAIAKYLEGLARLS
ncbi:hypothetical protein NL529_33845, partial [Klebsiella pneumoniae]|nr:hypothetical protein [Klebsiella pneumoniae]